MKHLSPEGWPRPKGFANGIEANGRMVFVAGMIGWDEAGRFEKGLVAQLTKTLENTVSVLAEAGARPSDIVRMTWFIKDLSSYRDNLTGVGTAYRDILGKNFPAMAVIGVSDLVEGEALIEIETTAVIEGDR